VLRITIHEGRKRQVRRMCEAVGHPVQRLVRVRFGPLALGALPSGRARPLTPDELRALVRAADGDGAAAARRQAGRPGGRAPPPARAGASAPRRRGRPGRGRGGGRT